VPAGYDSIYGIMRMVDNSLKVGELKRELKDLKPLACLVLSSWHDWHDYGAKKPVPPLPAVLRQPGCKVRVLAGGQAWPPWGTTFSYTALVPPSCRDRSYEIPPKANAWKLQLLRNPSKCTSAGQVFFEEKRGT
jgi:hypothetical protein